MILICLEFKVWPSTKKVNKFRNSSGVLLHKTLPSVCFVMLMFRVLARAVIIFGVTV